LLGKVIFAHTGLGLFFIPRFCMLPRDIFQDEIGNDDEERVIISNQVLK